MPGKGLNSLKLGQKLRNSRKARKMGHKWPKNREFSRKTGKFRSQDPVRSVFLAKDAKGAKKRQRYPKPLGEFGALCENPKMA